MIKKEFELKMNSPITLCDIEIANDITNDGGDWFYEKSDIITIGFYQGNKITIFQREKKDDINIWKDIVLNEIKKMPVMYCLNINMEKKGIAGFFGINRFFEEIRPFKGKMTGKDDMFNWLIKMKKVKKKDIPKDPFNGKSALVIQNYEKEDYNSIILHNKSCLIKEYFIFMNRYWMIDLFKDKIKDGWWNNPKPYTEHDTK